MDGTGYGDNHMSEISQDQTSKSPMFLLICGI
jgi:hypothetical protein